MGISTSFDGWTKAIMGSKSMMDALNMDLTNTTKNIETLSGQLITAAQAKQAFDAGGSFSVPTITVTSANKASLIAELQAIEAEYAQFPGRAPGGNGPTGLLPNDSAGWDNMLAEQVRYESLKAGLPGFESGGPTGLGGPAMLHPSEYVVPKNGALVWRDPGASSSATPAAPQTINLVVDGKVLASIVNSHNSQGLARGRLLPARG
jgi:hypothetical protein